MPPSLPLLDPRALARISNLEIVARKVVEGTISGLHRSPLHGFSTDFLQHRPYVAGDDLRYLDWKIFGRTDRHFVRQFEEETNLRATIFLDASGSMEYAGEGVSKVHYALRMAAALAYLFVHQQDEVGLIVFDDAVRTHVTPRVGRRQLQHILSALGNVQAGGETSLASVIRDVAPRVPRRGLLIFVSDAFDETDAFINALARLHTAHHEVILLQVLDRSEVDFRFPAWTRFESLEAEDESLVVDAAQVRTTYLERFRAFTTEIDEGCRSHGIDVVRIVTDQPYDEVLASYLNRRRRKS